MANTAPHRYDVYSSSGASSPRVRVTAVDTTLSPLEVLTTVVEGLTVNPEIGLWLAPYTSISISMVPKLFPFDLVYLDKQQQIIDAVNVLPGSRTGERKGKIASALVLPFQTISKMALEAGMSLSFHSVQDIPDGTEEVSPAEISPPPSPESPLSSPKIPPAEMKSVVNERPTPIGQTPSFLQQLTEEERRITETLTGQFVDPYDARRLEPQNTPIEILQSAPDSDAASPSPGAAHLSQARSRARLRGLKKRNWPAPHPTQVPLGRAGQRSPQKAAEESDKTDRADAPSEGKPRSVFAASEEAAHSSPSQSLPAPIRNALYPKEARPPLDRPVQDFPAAVVDPAANIEEDAAAPKSVLSPHKQEPLEETPHPENKKRSSVSPTPTPQAHSTLIESFNPRKKAEELLQDMERRATRLLHRIIPGYFSVMNRRGALRKTMPGLVAYHGDEHASSGYEIGNLSASGMYLLTGERWPLGTVVSLEVQRAGEQAEELGQRALVEAGTVRWDAQGLGLLFVTPNVDDIRFWEYLPDSPFLTVSPDTVIRELRMAHALTFLRQICPPASDEFRGLLHKEFSSRRVLNAVEIVLMTEGIVARDPETFKFRAHPKLVLNILNVGSWVDFASVRKLWAGLLATGCTVAGDEAVNLVFADKLTQFTDLHAQILETTCTPAVIALRTHRELAPFEVHCTAKEFVEATGTRNLNKIHLAVVQLSDLGLLDMQAEPSYAGETPEMRTSPTKLGLQLFARCYRMNTPL